MPPRPPAHLEAVGTALRGRPPWDQFDDMTTMAARYAASSMWERTSLVPADVDVAEMYNGFSFLTLCWIESLGFVTGKHPFNGHGVGRRHHRATSAGQLHRRLARTDDDDLGGVGRAPQLRTRLDLHGAILPSTGQS